MAEDFDYRSVLRKALEKLLDILDPVPILDQFTQDAFLPDIKIRDIRELTNTTDKNRAIVENVEKKGPKGYQKFKRFLRNAHQGHVADIIETIEKEVGTGQNQVPKPQTSDEGAGTLNIGGKGSVNTFRGQTNLENVNIGPQTTDGGRNNTRSEGDSRPRGQLQMDGFPYGAYGGRAKNTNIGGDGAINNFGGVVNVSGTLNLGAGGDRGSPIQTVKPSQQHVPAHSYQHQPPTNHPMSQQNPSDAIRSQPGQFFQVGGQAPPNYSMSQLNQPDAIRSKPGHFYGNSGQAPSSSGQSGPYIPGQNQGYITGQSGQPFYGGNQPSGNYAHFPQGGHPSLNAPGYYPDYTQGAQPPSAHFMYQQVPANNQLAGVQSSHYQPMMPPMNQPSSGHYQQIPAANQPPSGQYQQMPAANQPPNSQHQQMPAANQPPSGQHQQMPAANQPTSGQHQQMPAANQPPSGQHQQMPAANQPPSGQHQQMPAANQPTSGQHQQMPAANQPPSGQHQQMPADNQNVGNSSTFQEGNSLQNIPDPCQLIQGKPTQNVPDTPLFPEQGIGMSTNVGQTQPQQTPSLPKSMQPSEEVSKVHTKPVGGNVPDDKAVDSNKRDEASNTDKIEGIHVPPSSSLNSHQSDVNEAVSNTEDEYPSDMNGNTGDDISDIQSGFPSTRYEEINIVLKDVDDGRLHSAEEGTLERIIKGSKKLPNGSSGNVYCSNKEIKEWGIRIVVKKIKCTEDKYKSVINEIIAARIRHQSIVPLLANCPQYENHFYLVFPFMEKGDLMNAIKEDMDRLNSGQEAEMKADQRVIILYQIACAMLFLHTPVKDLRGEVFHGDITTRNIVRCRDGSARLLDFGVSQELKSAEEVIYARTGDPIGTPGYTTVVSKKELSPMTDCKNFGVVILEMLTGDIPKRGIQELQKVKLNNLERNYDKCYEKVWKKNDKVYGKLKKMAEQCLKKEINAEEISKSLHDILDDDFLHNWEPKNDDKCSMCILNHAVKNSDNLFLNGCENGNDHIEPPVCVSCMRNSYLNPIQCQRCRNTIRTKIGASWGAILIEGFDENKENQKVFSKDIEDMEKILTSKYPLFIGISPDNVFNTKMDKASEAVDRIKNEDSIKTVFIYYSGHYHKEFGFQTGKDEFMKKEAFQECFKPIRAEQDIILVMDCCYSGSLKDSLPQIKLQLSATRSEEKATFNRGGSLFTRLFIQSLRGKSTSKPCIYPDKPDGTCGICSEYRPEAIQSGFISVSALFKNINKHIKEYCKKKTIEGYFPTFYNIIDDEPIHLFIAYHIQDVTDIKFTCEDKKIGCCSIEELPCEMNELQMMLLEHVLKNSYKGVWSSYGHKYEQHWQKYANVIGVGIRTGPHPEHYHDLNKIPLVTDAWNKKLELQFGLRPVCNIKDGKVGVFMNDIKTEELMDNFLKSHHFNELLTLETDDQKVTRVTIPWVNISEYKVMDVLKTLKPTGRPALEAGYERLMDIWKALEQDQSIENAENLIMTIPSELRNPSFQFTENFFTMEIQYEEENEEMSTNDS